MCTVLYCYTSVVSHAGDAEMLDPMPICAT
jgi:hypothetical protein